MPSRLDINNREVIVACTHTFNFFIPLKRRMAELCRVKHGRRTARHPDLILIAKLCKKITSLDRTLKMSYLRHARRVHS